MAIEFIRDMLRIDQVVGEESSQALVESDIIVPEAKPDVAKILDISSNIILNSKDVIQDKVMVEGTIQYNVLYVADSDNGRIDSMDNEVAFTHYLEIPGVKPKMVPYIDVEVEHIDYDIINSRKISTKSVLNVQGKVRQALQLEAIQEFKDADKVEVLKDSVKVSENSAVGSSQTIIREDLELQDNMPSITEILRKDIKVSILDKRVSDNKATVNGKMDIGILYLCEDDEQPLHYFNEGIEFGHFVDIQGAFQGMNCDADVTVEDFYVEPKEDINGELRIVGAEVVLGVSAQVYETQEKEIIIDAYSPDIALDLQKREVKLIEAVGSSESQTVIKENITFPDGIPDVDSIFYVNAVPIITDQRINEGKVILECILSTNIIYKASEMGGFVGSFEQDIPFRQSVDIEGIDPNMDCQSSLKVDSVEFKLIAPDEVEIKATVTAYSAVNKTVIKELLMGVEETVKEQADGSGIFIYFIRPGDNLWDIAKRYNTTIGDILKYNEIADENNLEAGSKIVIYKRFDYKKSVS